MRRSWLVVLMSVGAVFALASCSGSAKQPSGHTASTGSRPAAAAAKLGSGEFGDAGNVYGPVPQGWQHCGGGKTYANQIATAGVDCAASAPFSGAVMEITVMSAQSAEDCLSTASASPPSSVALSGEVTTHLTQGLHAKAMAAGQTATETGKQFTIVCFGPYATDHFVFRRDGHRR